MTLKAFFLLVGLTSSRNWCFMMKSSELPVNAVDKGKLRFCRCALGHCYFSLALRIDVSDRSD